MPRTQDVAGAEQLGADGVVEHHLAREDAFGDQQAQVQRVRVGEPPAVPLADRERGDPHAQFMLRELAALGRQQLPELRVEVEQRPSGSGRARRAGAWATSRGHRRPPRTFVSRRSADGAPTRGPHEGRMLAPVSGAAALGRLATLLDADPGSDGSSAAHRRRFGHRRVLPVLYRRARDLDAARGAALGAGPVRADRPRRPADGRHERAGPGDRLEPVGRRTWIACTGVGSP